jgi:hypothetical protein
MSVFSENELYSLEDIANEFSLESENPILYGIYLARNPELNQDEKDNIKYYMNKLIKKQQNINKKNLEHLERHLQKA